VEGLWDTPKAILALLMQRVTKKNVLIISSQRENRLLDALPFFEQGETLDFLPPEEDRDILGKRLYILYALAKKKQHKKALLVHCPIQSLMHKLPSPSSLLASCMELRVGEELSFEELPSFLSRIGYARTPLTVDKGEFSVRGGLIDVFPASAEQPYRIDFFGSTIESIRSYDPSTQKSLQKVESLFLCPTSEKELLAQETKTFTLFDYLGKSTALLLDDPLAIEDAYLHAQSLTPLQEKHLFSLQSFLARVSGYTHVLCLAEQAENLSPTEVTTPTGRDFYTGKDPFQPLTFSWGEETLLSKRWNHPFVDIPSMLGRFENHSRMTAKELLSGIRLFQDKPLHLHFIVDNASEEKMIHDTLIKLAIECPKNTKFMKGYLPSGFFLPASHIAYLPTVELTHQHKIRRPKWRNTHHVTTSAFHELTPGDFVVHLHHGIGTFLGVDHKRNHLGQETEYLQIAYAKQSQLYVPVSQSHLVNRYIGSREEAPSLSVLGSSKWQKTYTQAQQAIVGYAKDLLDQTAKREVGGGFCFPPDSTMMQMFEESFAFEETQDQQRAITDIKQDMCSPKAMDRLLCGDVGYGKTEVAMRAAFKAICDGGKQVIVLVPTTLLALQHYDTFKERMVNFPIQMTVLTRFSTPKQCREILERMQSGSLDLLIGTHRIVQSRLTCKDLGLLIIDEEQRFGVRVKEHIKKYKTGVDCLTLSATPIPRTLYFSLIGIREISEISTPPQDRLPITSLLVEKDQALIKSALRREFARDGQAFFIHNRIETLPKVFNELKNLVPEAKIAMTHGQMDAEEIDTVFQSFKQGESDLLLSTTLVENGIDIPNANTIFIDRADCFGMADLYQLRGRVGRWNRPAYAYFLLSKGTTLTEVAKRRLQTLVDNSGYGSGLKIAMRDLEIRGAGDILGEQQSGHVSSIGFHLYCKLLKKAIEALKKQSPLSFFETKVEFPWEAKIPEEFVEEPSLRMEIYYRLGNTSSLEEVGEILAELQDRFGPLPRPVLLLGLFTRIRIQATVLQITLLKFGERTFYAEKTIGSILYKNTFPLPRLGKDLTVFEQEFLSKLKAWPLKK